MNTVKMLKRLLGGLYQFQKIMSAKQVAALQKSPPKDLTDTVVSILTAGCVKLEAVLFRSPNGLEIAYDVFVKDTPDSQEWISFDSLPTKGSIKETDMADALDEFIQERGLSYTECCFMRLDGKVVKKEKAAPCKSPCRPVCHLSDQDGGSTRQAAKAPNTGDFGQVSKAGEMRLPFA